MGRIIDLNEFNKQFNIFYKDFKKFSYSVFDNENYNTNIVFCKNINRALEVLKSINNILNECLVFNFSTFRMYFNSRKEISSYKNKEISKTNFYYWVSKVRNSFLEVINIEFLKSFVHKSKKPKNIKLKYSLEQRKEIADCYYNTKIDKNNFFSYNRKIVWYKFKKQLSRLSISTVAKIINKDYRSNRELERYKKHLHPPRKYHLPIGYVQADLKIIGPTETCYGDYIYIFDMIDEESKFLYTEVLLDKTEESIFKAMKNGIRYFKNNGIDVKRIRTDNAPEFKDSPYEERGRIHKFLISNKIKHEFITERTPQENGCIERHHRVLDDEVIRRISHLTNFWDYKEIIESWSNNFNFQRPATYTIYDSLYITPIEFLERYNTVKLIN